MKGRTPTADESRYMSTIVSRYLCWCCTQLGIENRIEDVLIHHIDGKTKPGAHYRSIPLCDPHHSPYSEHGLHYNTARWEGQWGRQEDIVEQIQQETGWKMPEAA